MADIDPRQPYEVAMPKPGEEISSTLIGRHVLIEEGNLVHPFHADWLVDKGDPVAFWDGVGVALKSAESNSDHIPVDTEGIWRLEVTNTGSTRWGTILVGQVLFIDSAGVINDDWTSAYAIFGYALEKIPAPENGPVTKIIAVKVHWMYPYWYYDKRLEEHLEGHGGP